MELITEGSKEDREKFLEKKGDCYYRYVNSFGREERACIIINEEIIKEDTAWMEKHNKSRNDRIDLELACAYQKELEGQYLEILEEMDVLSDRLQSLSIALRKEQIPELNPSEEDTKEEKSKKSDYRVVFHGFYRDLLIADIAKYLELKEKPEDIAAYLYGEKLYWFKSNRNYAKEFREELSNTLEMVVKKNWNWMETDENAYMRDWKESQNEKRKYKQRWIKRRAREKSYEQIFLDRDWGLETWMELVFCKFYHELNDHKPRENKKKWFNEKSKEWFYSAGKNAWGLTKEAAMGFIECDDEEKRLDLLNYRIVLNVSMYEEISDRLMRYGIKRDYLEKKAAIGEKGINKRFKGSVEMEPFTACTLWKECKFNFKNFFLVKEIAAPMKELEFRNKVEAVLNDGVTITDRIDNPKRFEKNFDENFYWYTPMYKVNPIKICVWLDSLKKVKIKVDYATCLMEPLMIELPYSGVMRSIDQLNEEKMDKMIEQTGCKTKEEILQYCAEIAARNYCKTILGISYEVFQRIKCDKK